MPAFTTIIAAVGVAASVASVAVGMQQASSAKKQASLAKDAEDVRKQQMNIDAMRKKRDMIRQAQVASAQSQASANAQGASASSSADGALAGISGQMGVNVLGVNQNQELGSRMFDINKDRADAFASSASMQSLSAGLGSLGGIMVKNAGTIGQVGQYFTGKP